MAIEYANRIKRLPAYIFARLDELKKEKEKTGAEVISFGVGDPDLPAPEKVIKKLHEASLKPKSNRYPSYAGMPELREAISQWYEARFNVSLNPQTEVLVLCGSKEGLAHIPQAFINEGDGVLVPSPGYPVYNTATIMSGGVSISVPQREEKKFLPDFEIIDRRLMDKAKMLFLNFPCNPTSKVVDVNYFEDVLDLSQKRELIVCHDNAYSEIYYDQKRPPSILQAQKAKEAHVVEFHSLSKTFNMAGFRVGFVVGNKKIIEALAKVKTNIDSGVYNPIQEAAIVALSQCWKECDEFREIYQKRRDYFCAELKKLKIEFNIPEASFYVWAKVPKGFSSESFSEYLIKEAGVMVTPGTGFGQEGQGFVRFALTIELDKISLGLEKIAKVLK
ncbi:MAG: LL-diaminopimelate aminotransferase [Oligoflexia bacterium]|nr:LL-diaminopimelate aminotransferase [Oligoflexia bacterium]